jgi:hypothetical protein
MGGLDLVVDTGGIGRYSCVFEREEVLYSLFVPES